MKRLALFLLLAGLARADVSVYSACPGDMTLKSGDREVSVGSRQSVNLSGSEVTVVNDQGLQVFKGPLVNNKFYVLCQGKYGKTSLLEAGSASDGGKEHSTAIGFFNALGFGLQLEMFSVSGGDEELTGIAVGPNQVSGAFELEPFTYKLFLKDEGGNPIGTSYTNVKPGQFYLVYHRRDNLYDVEKLGVILPKGK